jgi:DNA polymerase-3 subunit delta'
MTFKEIIGQNEIKQRLIKSVKDNRIAHAQLFFGPEGCGKLALAIAYAQFINCSEPSGEDSCGTCPSCNKYQKLIHPDLHFIFPVATTKKITKEPVSDDFIKQWRELLLFSPYISLQKWYDKIELENKQGNISKNESQEILKKLNLKTFEAEYKIIIIWLPEKMNIIAANKLLKILEEPPEKTLFLMISENTESLLQTIVSRTQLIKVPKITDSDLLNFLKQNNNLSESQLLDIVHLADGNFIKAITIFENNNDDLFHFEKFTTIMRLCWSKDVPGILKWCESFYGIGRERQKNFLLYSLRIIRANFLMNCQVPQLSLLTKEESEFSSRFFNFINNENIYQLTEEINKAHNHIESNANDKIVFLDMALKLIKLIRK